MLATELLPTMIKALTTSQVDVRLGDSSDDFLCLSQANVRDGDSHVAECTKDAIKALLRIY
jgi:hypothetical protein